MHGVRSLDTAYLWGLGGVKTRRVTGISGGAGDVLLLDLDSS